MSRKFITLKPLTPHFFGGENTFGDGKINYYAKSNYLPQQTTILGMLRYELLLQNKLIGTDPITNNWKDLIGDRSFQRDENKFVDDFGAIKKISPVFLSDRNEHYTTQALDWAYFEVDNNRIINNCKVKDKRIGPLLADFDVSTNEFSAYTEQKTNIPLLKVNNDFFDPKYGLVSLWVKSDGSLMRQWDYVKPSDFDGSLGFENGFFCKSEQIGIHRLLNRRRDDKGDFYKQLFLKLIDGYCFAFFADIDLPEGKVLDSRIITMGGERSVFDMQITDAGDKCFDSLFNRQTFNRNPSRSEKVIIVTSDCFCDNSIFDICKFTISETINFRNIITHQNTTRNYAAFEHNGVIKSSENLTLLKRGSVLFPREGNAKQLIDALTNEPFNKIGYNTFIEIN